MSRGIVLGGHGALLRLPLRLTPTGGTAPGLDTSPEVASGRRDQEDTVEEPRVVGVDQHGEDDGVEQQVHRHDVGERLRPQEDDCLQQRERDRERRPQARYPSSQRNDTNTTACRTLAVASTK